MCDRRQRVPVFGMDMGECPGDVGEVNAAGDPRILIDVARIVVVNEIVPKRLTKNSPRKHDKSKAEPVASQGGFCLSKALD